MKLFFALIQIGLCLHHYSDISKLIENYQTLVRFAVGRDLRFTLESIRYAVGYHTVGTSLCSAQNAGCGAKEVDIILI